MLKCKDTITISKIQVQVWEKSISQKTSAKILKQQRFKLMTIQDLLTILTWWAQILIKAPNTQIVINSRLIGQIQLSIIMTKKP